ncbi:prepilin-type N-terminal cleavage/methylation domain-containing protein [Lentibacillus cibarius]|uniref:Prepilin-type N-terminal cleavage/methylation domain-containing protein n=1 Tax=Lentibacillus cibarius TaxID=2583219 RepID=A0A5S3QK62_9BACI|nr:prepilin-type N-terminal cleavage/methylation domain-containing protein [Lentibacillus cibarius]TMN21591.1 prepilin-type N-terminal cleavage/methylation domain-containing protein [Lentibacillus cibarius]
MFTHKLNNEQGVTLVELLAALALLSLLIVLSTGLIVSISNNQQAANNDITLQQNTNVLISEMRKAYYNGSGEGELPFRTDTEKLRIKELKINGNTRSVDSPVEVDFDHPLHMKLTTASSDDQTVTVETTWRPSEGRDIVLKKPVTKPDTGNYDWVEKDVLPCYSTENIKLMEEFEAEGDDDEDEDDDDEDDDDEDDEENNCNRYDIQGALWLTEELDDDKHLQLEVGLDLFADDEFEIGKNSVVTVGKNAVFKDEADLDKNSRLEINGSGFFNGTNEEDNEVELDKNTELIIKKNGLFQGELDAGKNSKIDINGNANLKSLVNLSKNSVFIIGGNGEFNGQTDIDKNAKIEITGTGSFKKQFEMDKNAMVFIEKNSSFKDQVDLDKNATLKIKGGGTFFNQLNMDKNSSLFIYENATFNDVYKESLQEREGKLCVKGSISPSSIITDKNCFFD